MHAHIIAGGTFDGLHAGHEHFLHRVFSLGARVTLGLTSEAYIRRFKKNGAAPYSSRYQALTSWLRKHEYAARVRIVPLDNVWGPTLLPDGFDAIAVTRDNKHNAHDINAVRKERGLPPLAIVEIDLILAADNKPISSTRVRSGVIDARGHLQMPEHLRPELAKPLGNVLTGEAVKSSILKNRDNIIITVGDVTTETVFYCGVQPALAIIDLRVERKPYQSFEAFKFPQSYRVIRIASGPGNISHKAVDEIKAWKKTIRMRQKTVLVVDGEEDLLTLPAVAYAPLGSIVYYGSPPSSGQEGLVEIVVTKDKKEEAIAHLAQFT